jgi:hypothetical protein
MIFFFIISILFLAVIVLLNLFIPHKLPWYRPNLILHPSEIPFQSQSVHRQPVILEGLAEPEEEEDLDLRKQVENLDKILQEKNRKIEQLNRKLKAEISHREDFEKVKTIMEEELISLRKENRSLKSRKEEQSV